MQGQLPHRPCRLQDAMQSHTATRTVSLRYHRRRRQLLMPAPQHSVHGIKMAAAAGMASKAWSLEQVILAQAVSPIKAPLPTAETSRQWRQRQCERWQLLQRAPPAFHESSDPRHGAFCLPLVATA
jgi:hypothetical protein